MFSRAPRLLTISRQVRRQSTRMAAKQKTVTMKDGTKLSYRMHNEASQLVPLFMIHGWACVEEDWGALPVDLSEKRPVLVFDHRGIGKSDVPAGKYTVPMLTEDCEKLLEHVGIERAHVMGISMGGMIAQQLAVNRPGLIASLVLGCTTHGGKTALPATSSAFQWLSHWDKVDERRYLAEEHLRCNIPRHWIANHSASFTRMVDQFLLAKRPPEGIVAQLAALQKFNVANELSSIKAPTLVVQGLRDEIMPAGNADLIAQKLGGPVELLRLKDAGHMFWLGEDSDPQSPNHKFVSKSIASFLERYDKAETPPESDLFEARANTQVIKAR